MLERILILSVAGLGDFVLGTPALRSIREHFSGASIWLMTIPEVRPLAERCPYVDAVRTLNLRRSRSTLAWLFGAGRKELLPLMRELRSMRFTHAVNLHRVGTVTGGLRMAAFLRAVGAGKNIGREGSGRGLGLGPSSGQEGHETDAQLGVARLLGAKPATDKLELWVTGEDRQACATLMRQHGLFGVEPIACLHAGSAQAQKRWPADHFAVVGRRLAAAGACVLAIGAAAEQALCNALACAVPGAISLAGETTLPVLAALLERSSVLVTNDSGPMHMAAALGVPLVVPFGPGNPERYGPRGPAPCMVFSAPARSGGLPWWKGVPADMVAEAAVRVFAERSSTGRSQEGAL